MKTIGLIGGMSWESTAIYYEQLNQKINQTLGDLHSAKIILYSVDFQNIQQLQHANQWQQAGQILAQAAMSLEKAGAEVIALCTNTMHKVADTIEANINIPFLHIADATIQVLHMRRMSKVGLLGTAFTMEQDFYRKKFDQQGIQLLVPPPTARKQVHRIIYEELCQGIIHPESKAQYLNIIDEFVNQGVEGIILGCTEIGLLIQQHDVDIQIFDTTRLHVDALTQFALSNINSVD